MCGAKTKNKYTCADCKYHKCDCLCKNGEKYCNGFCIFKKRKRNCNTIKCSEFLLDNFFMMC